ncbi:MAG: gamma carbonic anhydrase family protein [Deltaproteobacteria bacterium CG11_big_fil_rev_8_21_14_0_20_49_13]|nr:MAG: gamma carbonic anhydrase family protein [Deltaproteobacteria bacterium CG11_big_fil_rev_8_21_14_0_20_49_13]
MLIKHAGNEPKMEKEVFIAGNASVIGKVEMGERSSVWFGAVIRGDDNSIKIGGRTNIQDLSVLHVDERHDVQIGDDCVVGHRVIIHGAHIGSRCLIGMGSIVMNGAKVGDDCIIGAGALVTEDQEIPPRSLVIGFPAKIKRQLTTEEVTMIPTLAMGYTKRAASYI